MNKARSFACAVLMSAASIAATAQQPITQSITLDTNARDRQFSLIFDRGATEGVRAKLYQNGAAWSSATNYGAVIFYSTNATASSGVIVTNSAAGSGYFDFNFTSNSTLGLSGSYPETNFCAVVVTNGAGTVVSSWAQGTVIVRPNPYTTGAEVSDTGMPFYPSNYTYIGQFPTNAIPPGVGGSNTALDLADDDSDESDGVTEIAVSGDTHGVFSEPSADKLLIDVSKAWPTAATATNALQLGGTAAASYATDSEVAAGYQPLDADLTDLADGELTGSKVGSGIQGGNISDGSITPAKLDRGYLPTATGGIVSNDVRLIAGSDFTVGPVLTDAPTHAALLFIATGGQASAFASAINNDLFGTQWGGAENDPYANAVLAGEDSGIWLIGKHEGSHANSLTLVTLDITNGWDYGFAVGMDTTNATSVGDFYILGGTSQDDMLTSSIFAPFRIDRQTEKVVIGGTTQRLGADLWGGIRIDALQVANSGFNSAWAYTPPSPYGSSGNTAAVIEGADAAAIIVSQDSGGQGSRLVLGEADTSGTFIDGWYWQKYTASGGASSRAAIGYSDSPTNVPLSTATNHNIRLDTDGSVTFPNATGTLHGGPITHQGDTNTSIDFGTDTVVTEAGGTNVVTVTPGGVVVDGSHAADSYSGDGSALTAVDAATGDSATGFFDTGTLELARGGTGQSLTDPNADGIFLWDDSDTGSEWTFAAIGSGLSFDGNTLSATASGAYVADSGGNATNLTLAGTTTLNGTLVATNSTLSVSNLNAQVGVISSSLTGTNTYANLFADISNTGAYWQADADSLDIRVPSGDVVDVIINATPTFQVNASGTTVAGTGAYQGKIKWAPPVYILSTNRTWTADELTGNAKVYITGASTQTLPAVHSLLDCIFVADAAVVVTVRPNASDGIRMDATTDADGDGVVSSGTADDAIAFGYYSSAAVRALSDGNWTAE